VEKTGILAGACLCGMLTLEQATTLIDSQQTINDVMSREISAWNCPLVTSEGILRKSNRVTVNDFQNLLLTSGSLNVEKCQEIINKESVYLHLDNELLKQKIISLDELGVWVFSEKEQSVVEGILTLLAKLYINGVRFNSARLFSPDLRRVLLPTYPFERKTFRVNLVQSQVDNDELLQLENHPTLSVEQRQSSYQALAKDMKVLPEELLLIETPSPLSPQQRQLSYLALSEDFRK